MTLFLHFLSFFDVFPIDLPRLLLEYCIKFVIDLELATLPISMATYYMALVDLKELNSQL